MPWLQRSETLESCCVLAVSLREPLDLARTGLTIGEPSASMRPRKHRALTPLREVTETTPPCVLAVRR
ncbi:Uncharacterised protein [Mycobacterium tuberculosis]|nr:Uncharacterised protein [Mycobacterium tuberculosis]